MTSETPEVVQVRDVRSFERCEKLLDSLATELDSLPAAMEPWKKVTNITKSCMTGLMILKSKLIKT